MTESHIFLAFIIGLISALSLPLGTITSAFWKPGDRMMAFLMAFGGGALLAALTIDLVGSALKKGHFHILAIGCIFGSMLFIGLNHIVNDYGGFLRKSSTTLYHVRRKGRKRFKQILSHVRRIDLFNNLPEAEAEELTSCFIRQEFLKGSKLYYHNDPCRYLYIIEDGKVGLLDPKEEMRSLYNLGNNDVFGSMAFFTGCLHATEAIATTDSSVWLLPKKHFETLIQNTPHLAVELQKFLKGEKVSEYLIKRQDMSPEGSEGWVDKMIQHYRDGKLSETERQDPEMEFKQIMEKINRIPVFHKLPSEEINSVASLFFRKHNKRGHSFFYQDESAERLYIVDHGEVELIDHENKMRMSQTLADYDAFGVMSFLTGAQHTMTAAAAKDTTVWILQKQDFERLLKSCPQFARSVEDFIKRGEISGYLTQKQHFNTNQAAQWTNRAVKRMEQGKHIPSAKEMAQSVKEHTGAPIAIWLTFFVYL